MRRTIHVMHARPLMTAGLAALLLEEEWQVSRHDERPEALAAADIVVADYDGGLALVHAPLPAWRDRQVLIVTHRDKEWDVRRALESCVAGYLLETTDALQLRHAVRAISNGARYLCPSVLARIRESLPGERLTGRESDVLQLLAKGLCNKRIARDLGIGVGTVKWHVRGLMAKLGASARTQAVVVAAQRGLIGIDMPAPR